MTPSDDALIARLLKTHEACLPEEGCVYAEAAARLRELSAEIDDHGDDLSQVCARAERAEASEVKVLAANISLKADLHAAEAEVARLRADAERFVWWFSDTEKSGVYINEYLRGVREHWTLDQWRASIDTARKDTLRCNVTRNLCGTDTWQAGHTCPCESCKAWLAGKRAGLAAGRARGLTDEMIAAGAAVLQSHISDAPVVYTRKEIVARIFAAMIGALNPAAE